MLKSGDDNKKYFTDKNDPNKITSTKAELDKLYDFGLSNMIQNQYFTKNNFYSYQGNPDHYDYINNKSPFDYYVTGFDRQTLEDTNGSFYIVHPDELCFERNILGSITNRSDDCPDVKIQNGIISSPKMKVYWNILTEYLLVVIDKENNDVYKTQLGENIMNMKIQMKSTSNLTLQHLISYIYSRVYNCDNDMLKLIAMYVSTRSPKDIIYTGVIDGKYRSYMEKALDLYGNCHGDSYALIQIANKVINYFKEIQNVSSFEHNDYKDPKILADAEQKKREFISAIKNKDYTKIDSDTLDRFLNMYYTNRLSRSDTLSTEEKKRLIQEDFYLNIKLNDILGNEKTNKIFEDWCQKQYLNPMAISSFIKNYVRLLNEIGKVKNKINEMDQDMNINNPVDLEWFDSHTPKLLEYGEYGVEDGIKISLMYGYPYNIVKNISVMKDNYYYTNIYSPTIQNVYVISKLYKTEYVSKKKIINDSFLKNTCMFSNILYIVKKEDSDSGDIEISYIENIHPRIISKVLPQILDGPQKYNIYNLEKETKAYLTNIIPQKGTTLLQNILKNYTRVVTEIRMDLYNNFNKNVFEKLKVVDSRENVQNIIVNTFKSKQTEINSLSGGRNNNIVMYHNNSYVQNIIDEVLHIYNKN